MKCLFILKNVYVCCARKSVNIKIKRDNETELKAKKYSCRMFLNKHVPKK